MNIHVVLRSVRFGFLFFSFGYPMQGLKTFGLIERRKKRGYSSMCSGRIIWVDLAAVWNEEDLKKRVENAMLVLVQGVQVGGDERAAESCCSRCTQ